MALKKSQKAQHQCQQREQDNRLAAQNSQSNTDLINDINLTEDINDEDVNNKAQDQIDQSNLLLQLYSLDAAGSSDEEQCDDDIVEENL